MVMRAIAAGLLAGLVLHTSQAPALDRLPDVLETSSIATPSAAQRHWSTRDLIEVRRIRSVAVLSRNAQTAFVVQQSFIDAGEDRYGLYVTNNQTPFRAIKVAESHFMGDLSADPRSDAWTVRADVGEGVQLYSMRRDGTHPLIVN